MCSIHVSAIDEKDAEEERKSIPMKKFLALLLAAMMLLASASVLAEEATPTPTASPEAEEEVTPTPKPESPVTPPVITVAPQKEEEEETGDPIVVGELGDVGQQYQEKIENGEEALTEDTITELKETLGDDISYDEIFGIELVDWTPEDGAKTITLEFATEFKVGDKVAAVLVYVKGEEITEKVLPAEVVADYTVAVTFEVEDLEQVASADEAFVLIVSANEAAAE